MTEPRFITAAEVEGGVIPRGGTTDQVLAKQSNADFHLKWATGGGGGGGLAEWDSGTEYSEGTIVLDRNGIWQATETNTNSQPVSGNTDWTLVGGTPYVDVVVDPIGLTTAPFYDQAGTGPGLATGIGAPGEGLYVYPSSVFALVSAGDNWSLDADALLLWGSFLLGGAAMPEITDGLDGTTYAVGMQSSGEAGGSSSYSQYPVFWNGGDATFRYNPANFVNLPLVLGTPTDITGAGAQIGSRSITYRIHYRILPFNASTTRFYVINNLDPESKTITVNGNASALTGSIIVAGSTGNDGTYTIVSATFDTDHTDIVVSETLPDGTADGWVHQ